MRHQYRIHRNHLLFILPIVLFILCMLLLLWAVIRQNLPVSLISRWPWKIELLDIQSATTAATITGGLILARAQYANTVKPMIGWAGNHVDVAGYAEKAIWLVTVANGCATPAYFQAEAYRVLLKDRGNSGPDDDAPPWITRDDAIILLRAVGLRLKVDYDLNYLGPAFPLSITSQDCTLAIFTSKAMGAIDDVLVRVRAQDLVGDVHERVIYCLRGAEREIQELNIPPQRVIAKIGQIFRTAPKN